MKLLPRFGRPPARRGNPNLLGQSVLTAAGYRVRHRDTDQLRRLLQPWQTRAFGYYDQLGEVHYAAQFFSRMLSPLRLYVSYLDDEGDWTESEDPDPKAKDALDRLQDPGGGREKLLSSYGRLRFLTGEALLLCSRDPDTDLEQWEILSTDELRVMGGVIVRYKAPSLAAEEYHEPSDDDWAPVQDDEAIVYRLWQPHPRFSMLADSTMLGVLDLCEELLLLTRAVRARARSRLAGPGILAVSDEFSYAPLDAAPDEDPGEDPFLADLTAAMMAPIADEAAASAVVPIVLRGPTEAIEKGIRHIQIIDPTQLYPETGLRNELVRRFAIGIDMPPEELLGLSDANHWSSWIIDAQSWKAHGQPLANGMVADLNAAYYQPQLRADGVEDWQRWRIGYDPAAVINHPDRTKDAKEAYDREVVGKEWYREQIGAPEDAAMTRAELAERIGIKTRDSSLAWYGIPSVKAGGVEPTPGEIVSSQGEDTGPTTGPTTGAEVEPGPPAEPPDPEQELTGGASAAAVARLVGACDLALLRAREVAGNRLRSLAKRDDALTAKIDGVPARQVAFHLGASAVRGLRTTEAELVQPASALIRDSLRLWRLDGRAADLIVEQIERHAARTLYEERPSPLPPQFEGFVAELLRPGRNGDGGDGS